MTSTGLRSPLLGDDREQQVAGAGSRIDVGGGDLLVVPEVDGDLGGQLGGAGIERHRHMITEAWAEST